MRKPLALCSLPLKNVLIREEFEQKHRLVERLLIVALVWLQK